MGTGRAQTGRERERGRKVRSLPTGCDHDDYGLRALLLTANGLRDIWEVFMT